MLPEILRVNIQPNLRVLDFTRMQNGWALWLSPRELTHVTTYLILQDDGEVRRETIRSDGTIDVLTIQCKGQTSE